MCWTRLSVESRWVRGEARDAADRGVLVPLRFDGAKLPIDFRAVPTSDLDGWGEDRGSAAFKGLVKALEAKLGAPRHLIDPGNLIMLYNFACAMVQFGDYDTAFELLPGFMQQMHAGLLRWLESDSDFDPIRGDPRFVALLGEARQRLGVTG